MAERHSAGDDVMTTPMPSFTSEAEFNQYTFNLSKQLKSIKLNALRSAMAKAAGFSHVDALIAHLNAQSESDTPAISVALDKRVFVRNEGPVLSFRCPTNANLDDPNIDTVPWRALESLRMTGNADLLDDVKIITVDGKAYLHGNVRDHKLKDLQTELLKLALDHFLGQYKEQCPGYWVLQELQGILLAVLEDPNQLINTWLRERMLSHTWGVPVDYRDVEKQSMASEGFVFSQKLKELAIMEYSPVKYQMEWEAIIGDPDYRGTTDEVKKDALATSLLNRHLAIMISTAFNVLIAAEGRERIKAMSGRQLANAVRRNKQGIEDYTQVTFFAQRVVQVHELERLL